MGQRLALPYFCTPLAAHESPELPTELIFKILDHCRDAVRINGRSSHCDFIYVVRFRLLSRNWNEAVVLWLKSLPVSHSPYVSANKPSSVPGYLHSLFGKTKRSTDDALLQWKRQFPNTAIIEPKTINEFPEFCSLSLVISCYPDVLTEPELIELTNFVDLGKAKQLDVYCNAREIAVSNKVLKRFLSQKLSESLIGFYWKARSVTREQNSIVNAFIRECANLQRLSIEIDRDSLSYFLRFAKELCDVGRVRNQYYSFGFKPAAWEFSSKITKAHKKLIQKLCKSIEKANAYMCVEFSEHILLSGESSFTRPQSKVLANKRILYISSETIENTSLVEILKDRDIIVKSISYSGESEIFITATHDVDGFGYRENGFEPEILENIIRGTVERYYTESCTVHVTALPGRP